jgi:hypothetical protein
MYDAVSDDKDWKMTPTGFFRLKLHKGEMHVEYRVTTSEGWEPFSISSVQKFSKDMLQLLEVCELAEQLLRDLVPATST